ncbi:MAG: hypothetical protein WCN98_15885 [Verrucomicrobiaceae bacterium]
MRGPPPQQPHDVCFGDKIYKRSTKANGIVSGQMPPIKPSAPKL